MRLFIAAFVLLLAVVAFAVPASADTISYDMGNHPDAAKWNGSATDGPSGPYGMRWDDGTGISGGADGETTFSAGDNGLVVTADDQADKTPTGGLGSVTLTYDTDLTGVAKLTGTMFDNEDVAGGGWTLDFSFTGLSTFGGNGWKASGGSGTLTRGATTINLSSKTDGSGDVA